MRFSKMIRSLTYGLRRLGGKAVIAVFLSASAANAVQINIVALGDSLTQGHGLPEWQGFVPVMESWLRDQNVDVKLTNAGVSGDTSAGGLARVDWTLTDDIHGVIVEFGGNDMLRGFPPELARANIAQIIEKAQAKNIDVLLVGIKASRNYGQQYKDEFDAIYPSLAEEYGVAFYPDFMAALKRDRTFEEMRTFLQSDGLHPTAEGVQMIVKDMGPSILGLIDHMDHW